MARRTWTSAKGAYVWLKTITVVRFAGKLFAVTSPAFLRLSTWLNGMSLATLACPACTCETRVLASGTVFQRTESSRGLPACQ